MINVKTYYVILFLCMNLCCVASKEEVTHDDGVQCFKAQIRDSPSKDFNIDIQKWTEFVESPTYVKSNDQNRHFYDTCIVEKDIVNYNGKTYQYSYYYMLPSLSKSAVENFMAYCFTSSDTSWIKLKIPSETTFIMDTPETLTLVRLKLPIEKNYIGRNDIDKLLYIFKNTRLLPIARFNKEGLEKDERTKEWVATFRKKYYKNGVDIINIDGQNFSFFIKFPDTQYSKYDFKKNLSLFPPWLLYDFSDYYCYFSRWGCCGIELPAFDQY